MDVIDDIESDVARSGKAIFFLRGVGTPCVVAIVTRAKTDLFDFSTTDTLMPKGASPAGWQRLCLPFRLEKFSPYSGRDSQLILTTLSALAPILWLGAAAAAFKSDSAPCTSGCVSETNVM